ncbi:MAG: hypothetical protein Q4E34_02790 [Synergistaceae bacterium]|nr:hypothetical protein [Synergistaceae bacterium]
MANNYDLSTWKKDCIKIGAPTNLLAAATAFLPVLYLCMKYNCWPNISYVLEAWLQTALLFGAFYIVEPISYYASLGMAGTYLSFLSGNIGNMRVPCAALALDVTKSEAGTIQAEIVSTMAICGSIITNLIATTAAAICGAAVVAMLPESISLGLKVYASAAIFGATLGNFGLKQPKLALCSLAIPVACKLIGGMQAWLVIVLSVFGTVAIARMMYTAGKKKAA